MAINLNMLIEESNIVSNQNINLQDYWIRDIKLAEKGMKKLEIAEIQMPGIEGVMAVYEERKPLRNVRITGCVTLTKETGILILGLIRLGASVRWCSDNRFAICDEVSAALVVSGVPVFGMRNETEDQYFRCMERALAFKDEDGHYIGPTQIIDDGSDITSFIFRKRPELVWNLVGISEQTTCGVNEVNKLISEGLLKCPVVNVNDTFVKNAFDNYFGVRESVISALQITLSLQIAGMKTVVYGYGQVGSGTARALKSLGAHVRIVEIDILKAIQAHMDGFPIISRKDAISSGQLFITATGCNDVIEFDEITRMNSGAILCNIGHGSAEYDHAGLVGSKITMKQCNSYI
jgi:adenosylhomocysteinase